ncbi:hypothetical protein ACIP2Y_00420 [Streptomyces sviceus]|uniref:hypothetical protein n=1 Tax=Streptomyces sviceus TaxID=285530 RepID=UPI003829BB9C
MTGSLEPGPAASVVDLQRAQERRRLLSTELPRVRETALAWRNGLGALLAGLVGFSLIKGRSDVSQLSGTWAVAVGCVLLLALVLGGFGAFRLIRAAHGRPALTDVRDLVPGPLAEHSEALDSLKALSWGVRLTATCALLLVTAVGMTWYGPEKEAPSLQITTPSGPVCGTTVRADAGKLVLKTSGGEVIVDLTRVTALQAVAACPP